VKRIAKNEVVWEQYEMEITAILHRCIYLLIEQSAVFLMTIISFVPFKMDTNSVFSQTTYSCYTSSNSYRSSATAKSGPYHTRLPIAQRPTLPGASSSIYDVSS
jgi:hypothetical protein